MKGWPACLVLALATMSWGVAPNRLAAQRDTAEAPVALSVTAQDGSYRVVITLEAREPVEIAADRRLLRAELRDARGRTVHCRVPLPRAPAYTVSLARGARWSQWLDLRDLCWGRALAALAQTVEVRWSFDAGTRRGAWAARTPSRHVRALAPVTSAWRAPSASRDPDAALRVELAPVDAARPARPVLRVRIVGLRRARAFIRPEAVSFRVRAPSGRRFECRPTTFHGRALPDFFVRLAPGRVSTMALDGAAYCGPLEEPGIHEVTPVLTLTERGDAWRLDALTGTFVGEAAPLRVRASSYVDQPVE